MYICSCVSVSSRNIFTTRDARIIRSTRSTVEIFGICRCNKKSRRFRMSLIFICNALKMLVVDGDARVKLRSLRCFLDICVGIVSSQ